MRATAEPIFRMRGTRACRPGPLGRSLLPGAATAILAFGSAVAAPPDQIDPELSPWFESLTQPGTGAKCCGISDCRVADFRRDADGYEVKVDRTWGLSATFWLRVPSERILDRTDNPTGQAVLCFTPAAGILCFVRPPES
jgi:hypothetical protein